MTLFPELASPKKRERTTFRDNSKLPIHNWFKYSAGFSADWVTERLERNPDFRIIGDPFAGSGTTMLASALVGRHGIGFESHPFVYRVAQAKSNALIIDPDIFFKRVREFVDSIPEFNESQNLLDNELMIRIFDTSNLSILAKIRTALESLSGDIYDSVIWLGVVSMLRSASHVGTVNWQYVLPNKSKYRVYNAINALSAKLEQFASDIYSLDRKTLGTASILNLDSRNIQSAEGVVCDAIITSPPYANNFDYADATRIEMTFLGEIAKWGDLQNTIRKHIVRSSTQHVSPYKKGAFELLDDPILKPISDDLAAIYRKLSDKKFSKSGKKDYDAMLVYYFYDMAHCLATSRKMLTDGGKAYFVIGDSAPYGIHVPVEEFLGRLSLKMGFFSWKFAKERDRNTKWKNRKHDHPLKEGFLILRG